MLHEKFVDKEVIVRLPEKWEDPDTARKVDERLGTGVFEEHAQFHPNNESRIAMAWQLKEVQGGQWTGWQRWRRRRWRRRRWGRRQGGGRPPPSSAPMGITNIHVHIHPPPL